ncbi:MAG: translation initiation factor IF-5A [Candidatus Nezhaarchaeota archaeon]|nr:translation initiation factor IF-5A [Candidatus Nezhaarchaeota archaeon]
MSKKPVDAGSLKVGSYIVIDDVPCRIVEMEKSKPGKHGSAKARIVAIGLFDGVKRSIVVPVDQKVEQPVVEKRSAQVIALTPNSVQLMDLSNYEVYEVPKSEVEPSLSDKLSTGVEVEVWEVLGHRRLIRIK